jgi:hypothetical protein
VTPSKPPLTGTAHVLPFDKLSPLDFERLCLWLVEREGYARVEHLGLAGSEQGRDVVAYKPTPDGDELWYFQCKRYASIRAKTLKDEVDKYLALVEERPELRPIGVAFVVSCAVSAKVREEVGAYCEQHGLQYTFWALTELDMRVKQHPDLLVEFFGLQSQSSLECAENLIESKSYREATNLLADIVRRFPKVPKIRLLYALALLGGRNPDMLTNTEANEIESHLLVARSSPETKFAALVALAVIKHDCYLFNGIDEGVPNLNQILEEVEAISTGCSASHLLAHLNATSRIKQMLHLDW